MLILCDATLWLHHANTFGGYCVLLHVAVMQFVLDCAATCYDATLS